MTDSSLWFGLVTQHIFQRRGDPEWFRVDSFVCVRDVGKGCGSS